MEGRSYFLDTSALFKRYVAEKGSNAIGNLFEQRTSVLISEITLCEVISNLRRLVDVDKIIKEDEFEQLKATFLGDVGDEILELIELTPGIVLNSLEICSKQYTTPIDAIQLASALSLLERPIFVCSDQKLLRLADEWGLPTFDPLDCQPRENYNT